MQRVRFFAGLSAFGHAPVPPFLLNMYSENHYFCSKNVGLET